MSMQFGFVICDHVSSVVQFLVEFIRDYTFFSVIYGGIIAVIAVQMRNVLHPSTAAAFPIDCFRTYFTI
jgi:hypothetical protein